jgi:hypothetical protein
VPVICSGNGCVGRRSRSNVAANGVRYLSFISSETDTVFFFVLSFPFPRDLYGAILKLLKRVAAPYSVPVVLAMEARRSNVASGSACNHRALIIRSRRLERKLEMLIRVIGT